MRFNFHPASIRSLDLRPNFKFRRHLDPPWTDRLGASIKITSALILLNTTLIFILGLITSTSIDLTPLKSDYVSRHTMLLHAELLFFYLTIPVVYLATNVTENWCLWEDKLRPLYVIAAAVIAVNIWVLQLTVWVPCVFAEKGKGPVYCPYVLRHGDGNVQKLGSPRMVVFCVPGLFVL